MPQTTIRYNVNQDGPLEKALDTLLETESCSIAAIVPTLTRNNPRAAFSGKEYELIEAVIVLNVDWDKLRELKARLGK